MSQKIYITAEIQFDNSSETMPVNITMDMPIKDSVPYNKIMDSIKADKLEEYVCKTISNDVMKIIPGTVKIITQDEASRLNEKDEDQDGDTV